MVSEKEGTKRTFGTHFTCPSKKSYYIIQGNYLLKLDQFVVGIHTRGHSFTFCQCEPYSGIRYELSRHCAACRGTVLLVRSHIVLSLFLSARIVLNF